MSKTDLRKYFSQTLADNLWKALKTEDRVDFHVLYDIQDDTDIRNFRIAKAVPKPDGIATVAVTFINFGDRKRIDYKLGKGGDGSWRIVNVFYYGGGRTFNLEEILRDGNNY